MSHDLYVAMSGALSRLDELDLIANNLANAETDGFKRVHSVFSSTLQERLLDVDGNLTDGAAGRIRTGTSTPAVDLDSGAVRNTGNPLHVAILGEGFFQVETPEGPRFTRSGAFKVNADGILTTSSGHPVLGDGAPIETGGRSLQITHGGDLVDERGFFVGRLSLFRFDDPADLKHAGQGLLEPEPGVNPEPVISPQLVERSLESSNVEPVEELASLVMVQRIFEMNMRTMQAEDQATARLLREIGS